MGLVAAHSLWVSCISRSRRRPRGHRRSHRPRRIRSSPERSRPITPSGPVGGALSRSRASPLTRAVTRCGPGGHGCPVRQPAGHRRPGGRPRPEDPAGRQHHRRRPGQDRLPTEPGHRLNRGGRPRILRDSGGAVRAPAPATSDRGRPSHPRTAFSHRRLRPSTHILAASAVLATKVRPRGEGALDGVGHAPISASPTPTTDKGSDA